MSWQLYAGVPGSCRFNKAVKTSLSATKEALAAVMNAMAMKREATIMTRALENECTIGKMLEKRATFSECIAEITNAVGNAGTYPNGGDAQR